MQSITIPSEADIAAIDTDSLVWDDLMDGTLNESTGACIKAILDEIDSTAITININEQNAATGKTAKYINDNCANSSNWKIVSTDQFTDTFLTTSEYFENVGNAANVYKNDTSGSTEVEFDEAGNAVVFRQLDIHNDNAVVRTIDLTVAPEPIGVNDLIAEVFNDVPNSHIVNAAGTALAADGNYAPHVEIVCTWLVSTGFPIAEANGARLAFIRAFKRLPTNGLLIIPSFGIPTVNEAYWDVAQALQLTGVNFEADYRDNTEADGSGYWNVCVIKKL
jgi:hypothetical protein